MALRPPRPVGPWRRGPQPPGRRGRRLRPSQGEAPWGTPPRLAPLRPPQAPGRTRRRLRPGALGRGDPRGGASNRTPAPGGGGKVRRPPQTGAPAAVGAPSPVIGRVARPLPSGPRHLPPDGSTRDPAGGEGPSMAEVKGSTGCPEAPRPARPHPRKGTAGRERRGPGGRASYRGETACPPPPFALQGPHVGGAANPPQGARRPAAPTPLLSSYGGGVASGLDGRSAWLAADPRGPARTQTVWSTDLGIQDGTLLIPRAVPPRGTGRQARGAAQAP